MRERAKQSRSLFFYLRDRAEERREPEGVVRMAAAGERGNSEPCEPAVQHGLHAGSGGYCQELCAK